MMVNRRAADRVIELWRNGLHLEAALELFEPEIDRGELERKANEQQQIATIGKRNLRIAGAEAFDPILDVLGEGLAHLSKASSARQSRIWQLLNALERGELVALGFPTDRPKAAAPEPVPNFLIQFRFAKFPNSEFSDGHHRYSKVRIVASDALPPREIGRPSVRKLVLELASSLVGTQGISRDMPPKVQAREIRKAGQKQFPDKFTSNTPSDQTIQRHLKSFWNSN